MLVVSLSKTSYIRGLSIEQVSCFSHKFNVGTEIFFDTKNGMELFKKAQVKLLNHLFLDLELKIYLKTVMKEMGSLCLTHCQF